MFVFRLFGSRRRASTRRQLIRQEFGAGVGHLKQAAAHAADGLGETVRRANLGPSSLRRAAYQGVGSAMIAFAPFAAAARQRAGTARQASSKGRKQQAKLGVTKRGDKQVARSPRAGSKLFGLVLLGAAAGAAAVVVRRRRQRWGEFDLDEPFDAAQPPSDMFHRTITSGADGGAESTAARLSSTVEMTGTSLPLGGTATSGVDAAQAVTDDLVKPRAEGAPGAGSTDTTGTTAGAARETAATASGQGATATRKPTSRPKASDD